MSVSVSVSVSVYHSRLAHSRFRVLQQGGLVLPGWYDDSGLVCTQGVIPVCSQAPSHESLEWQ